MRPDEDSLKRAEKCVRGWIGHQVRSKEDSVLVEEVALAIAMAKSNARIDALEAAAKRSEEQGKLHTENCSAKCRCADPFHIALYIRNMK